jgi:hypothetical protein
MAAEVVTANHDSLQLAEDDLAIITPLEPGKLSKKLT